MVEADVPVPHLHFSDSVHYVRESVAGVVRSVSCWRGVVWMGIWSLRRCDMMEVFLVRTGMFLWGRHVVCWTLFYECMVRRCAALIVRP